MALLFGLGICALILGFIDHDSDLAKFFNLYLCFGVECKVIENKDKDGWFIILAESDLYDDNVTTSDKFKGYNGFYTQIEFDKDGQFTKQGFWE